MSPTSSRNSVPPSASSNRPSLRLMAPVKAPFSCPNSSDSSSVSASAPQLTFTNGLAGPLRAVVDGPGHQLLARARLAVDQHRDVGRRHLLDGLVQQPASGRRARRSRPRRRRRRRRRAAPPPRPRPAPGPASPRAAPAPARPSAAAPRAGTASAGSPWRRRRMASTAVSTVPKAVTISTGQAGSISFTARVTSRPPTPSIFRSVMTKSAPSRRMRASPSAPPAAVIGLVPHAAHGGGHPLAHGLVVVDDQDAGHRPAKNTRSGYRAGGQAGNGSGRRPRGPGPRRCRRRGRARSPGRRPGPGRCPSPGW